MAFSDWESYVLLLDELRDKRMSWDSASYYADFDKLTTTNCAVLKEGDRGLDSLVTALRPDYLGNDDLMYEQIKIAALARPAETLRGFGQDWKGYFVSERLNGAEVCSQSRYAAPADWEPVDDAGGLGEIAEEPAGLKETEVPPAPPPEPAPLTYDNDTGLWYDEHYWYLADGVTVVEPVAGTDLFADSYGNRYARGVLYKEPDLRQEHFDQQTGRTRRAYGDGLFEYLHENGQDWERTVVVGGQSFWGRPPQRPARLAGVRPGRRLLARYDHCSGGLAAARRGRVAGRAENRAARRADGSRRGRAGGQGQVRRIARQCQGEAAAGGHRPHPRERHPSGEALGRADRGGIRRDRGECGVTGRARRFPPFRREGGDMSSPDEELDEETLDEFDDTDERPSKRVKFTFARPVAQIEPVELGLLSTVESDQVREALEFSATALYEDVQGTLADPVWEKVQEKYKTDSAVKFLKKPPRRSTPATLKKKPKGVSSDDITSKGIAETFRKEMLGSKGQGTVPKDKSAPGGVFQKGANQPGSWKADGEVSYVEGPRNYTAEFDVSLANQLSQTVINYLKSESTKITEAQALILDDRVLISSNEAQAARDLIGQSLAKNLGTVSSKVEPWAKERQLNLKALRAALRGEGDEAGEERLALIVASANIHPEQSQALGTLLRVVRSSSYYQEAGSDAASWVTNSKGKGKIIVVGSQGFCHAEQNLLAALARSGYKGQSATVAGGKRPCTACHVALELVKRYKFNNLVYVERHGGAWYSSSKVSFAKIAEALGIDLATVKSVASELLSQKQYATALGSDAPETRKVTDLRDKVLKKKVATDRLPEEIAPPKGIISGYDEFVPDPRRVAKEEEFEASYEMDTDEEDT